MRISLIIILVNVPELVLFTLLLLLLRLMLLLIESSGVWCGLPCILVNLSNDGDDPSGNNGDDCDDCDDDEDVDDNKYSNNSNNGLDCDWVLYLIYCYQEKSWQHW